jgi:mannose-6-phosphate isomerase
MTASIRRIEPKFVERVWGRSDLSPLFGQQDRKIGEVWFPLDESFPLLVKFLFTDERLSVQVHPNDEYAMAQEKSRGKTEMWHVLSAASDASIALGFRQSLRPGELRSAVADGSVEKLLHWIPVSAGDTYFVPAGVVHALGAGVVLCEIQQNSDVTYRLYDYGRPRELHIEKALAVADLNPYDGVRPMPVRCDQFTTELLRVHGSQVSELAQEHLLIPVAGRGSFNGQPFAAGEAWHVPAGEGAIAIESATPTTVLRARAGSAET